ncbi:MAG: C39 family peptidase [Burkholderiales bacterium]|nr:C39 family peptidase [Burkholderiales bacterium]
MMRRVFFFFLCTVFAAGTAGAGTLRLTDIGGTYSVPVVSMKEGRFLSTLRQQLDFSCGSAAIATLLTHHYGYPVGEQAIFQEMFAKGDQNKIRREGFSLLDMKRFLEARGFAADGFIQPLDKLSSARIPAIVLISEKGYFHFVVVKGMRDGRILIGDPANGTRAIARDRFEAMWVNRLLFVIHNRQNRARFNLDSDWNSAPRAPVADSLRRDGLDGITLPKHGLTDF